MMAESCGESDSEGLRHEEDTTISLKTVLVVRTAGCVIALALLISLWTTSNYEVALDDTKQYDKAMLERAFQIGSNSTGVLVSRKLNSLVTLIMDYMETYFEPPQLVMREASQIALHTLPNYTLCQQVLSRYIWNAVQGLWKDGVTEIAYIQTDPPVLLAYFYDQTFPNFSMLTIRVVPGEPLPEVLYSVPAADGKFTYGPCVRTATKFTGNCTVINKDIAGAIYAPPTTAGGMEIVPQPLRAVIGFVSISFQLHVSQNLMIDLGLRTIFLSETFASISLPAGSRLAGVQQYKKKIGTVLGTSHGPAFAGNASVGFSLINITDDIVDHKLRLTALDLFQTDGWREQTFDLHLPDSDRANSTMEYHWGIVKRYNLSASLLYWIVVIVPEKVILGDIVKATNATRAAVAASVAAADDSLNTSKRNIIIINVVTGVLLIGLSFMLSHATTEPLHKLQKQMLAVSNMDLEAADEARKSKSLLTEVRTMQSSFVQMVANLREYRSYLPDAVLVTDHEVEVAAGNKAPEGEVTMVFTDIQGSTSLWEAYGTTMGKALKLHNAVMRKNILEHNGYEVKTIGDAFMVAFSSPADAVRFCLATQEGLLKADWPPDILQAPSCAPETIQSQLTWTGFRVRMGVHTGNVELEANPVTGRADYFGNVVNTTARIEATGIGGTVGVTKRVLDLIENEIPSDSIVVTPQGAKVLKGVSQKVELFSVVPKSLQHRAVLRFRDLSATQPDEVEEIGRSNSGHSIKTRSDCSTRRKGPAAVKIFMKECLGTVAHMEFKFPLTANARAVSKAMQLVAVAIDNSAERTFGLISYICGNSTVVTWNTGRSCTQHALNASRFCSFFQTDLDAKSVQSTVCIGLCTGIVVDGNAGSEKRRFMTTIGSPLELSRQAAVLGMVWWYMVPHTGHTIDASVLIFEYASCPGPASEPSIKPNTRPLGKFTLVTKLQGITNIPEQHVTIHQLRVVLSSGRWGFDEDDSEEAKDWTDSRSILAKALKENNPEVILGTNDPTPPMVYAASLMVSPVTMDAGIVITMKNLPVCVVCQGEHAHRVNQTDRLSNDVRPDDR